VIASVAAAFLLPLTEGSTSTASRARRPTALVMVALTTRSVRAGPSPPPERVGVAVLGAVYPGLLLGTVVRATPRFPTDSPGSSFRSPSPG